ncbi:hypothetical protein [Cohnella panacarvi]|uniref:hypothetical protein n=1 Tax=Cohnella panacarvi TaxID=400776 RepID=UPI00047BE8AA|nr:hypothetical protein [Cohnella panacarvi]
MKLKKWFTVPFMLAMILVSAQSVFAQDPYYTNPNGTVQTARTLYLNQWKQDQLSFNSEVDYFKVNLTNRDEFITVELKCPPAQNCKFTVFEYQHGAFYHLLDSSRVSSSGLRYSRRFRTIEDTFYIAVSGADPWVDWSTQSFYSLRVYH